MDKQIKERGIIFNAEMVRAILSGNKTQTRRILSPRQLKMIDTASSIGECYPLDCGIQHENSQSYYREWSPFGQVGERLWVVTMKPIAFGDGKFAAGDDGNIYNISGINPVRRRVSLGEKGYEEIGLRFKGKQQRFRVNRLVAEAFYGESNSEFPICRHLDGDKRNNKPENLGWGTSAQNTADANANGAWSGEANGSSILSKDSVEEIRNSSEKQSVLAERYGVTQPTISKIKSGKRWAQRLPEAPLPNHPRWASRITLEITDIRVERLNDISEEDAVCEGLERYNDDGIVYYGSFGKGDCRPEVAFSNLWKSMYGEDSWQSNPFVWVIEFKRVEA